MYRQGDILIVPVSHRSLLAERQRECILALGEATGHKHQILEHAYLWVDDRGAKYVEVIGPEATVVHEEHTPLTLPGPALYQVVQQREYTPGDVRYVAD
jgi:hypothetical protein